MSRLRVLTIPQADGGVRYLAVSREDAAAVRRDRAMVDTVTVLACLDVARDGRAEWGATGVDTVDGRYAIRDAPSPLT